MRQDRDSAGGAAVAVTVAAVEPADDVGVCFRAEFLACELGRVIFFFGLLLLVFSVCEKLCLVAAIYASFEYLAGIFCGRVGDSPSYPQRYFVSYSYAFAKGWLVLLLIFV